MDAVAIHIKAKIPTNPCRECKRTVIFIYGKTQPSQDMFIRGGIDHEYANNILHKGCSRFNYNCAIPIRHLNMRNSTTTPWKEGDYLLDWYGQEKNQKGISHGFAQGTPLDWTTDRWPTEWGNKRTVAEHGYGEETLNKYGQHYWMLDVEMDCSKTVNGWFELKSYISNGPNWEKDIKQPDAPYVSKNHFGQCGQINVFKRNEGKAEICDWDGKCRKYQ
jgi:alpha-amylase